MNKTLVIVSVLVAILGGLYLWSASPSSRVAPISTFKTQVKKQEIGIPKRIVIPAINVDAEIEVVGQDSKGKMDVPKNFMNVGWYEPGYRVGQNGSAVLSGHLDTEEGYQAVFWKLTNLVKGDKISVFDGRGTEYTFKVLEKVTYPYDQLPLGPIFDTYGEERLNLITCEGELVNGNYTHRLVVYSIVEGR